MSGHLQSIGCISNVLLVNDADVYPSVLTVNSRCIIHMIAFFNHSNSNFTKTYSFRFGYNGESNQLIYAADVVLAAGKVSFLFQPPLGSVNPPSSVNWPHPRVWWPANGIQAYDQRSGENPGFHIEGRTHPRTDGHNIGGVQLFAWYTEYDLAGF